MREALQSSRCLLYLKNEYMYGPRVKWVEIRLETQFSAFFRFLQRFWSRPSFLVATQSPGCNMVFWWRHHFLVATWFSGGDTISWSRLIFWTATGFSSLSCRGHNFFVLTQIWMSKDLLESSFNVACDHGLR